MATTTDGTTLNTGTGGDVIQDEYINTGQGLGTEVQTKVPISKIYTGKQDQSEGPVYMANPLPVQNNELVELMEKQTKILMMILMALDSTVNEDDIADL